MKRKETKDRDAPKKNDAFLFMYYILYTQSRACFGPSYNPQEGHSFMTIRLYNDTIRFELCVIRQITGVKPF